MTSLAPIVLFSTLVVINPPVSGVPKHFLIETKNKNNGHDYESLDHSSYPGTSPPNPAAWSKWSEWGKCSKPCDIEGFRKRTRKCVDTTTQKEEKGKCKPYVNVLWGNKKYTDTDVASCIPCPDEDTKTENAGNQTTVPTKTPATTRPATTPSVTAKQLAI